MVGWTPGALGDQRSRVR